MIEIHYTNNGFNKHTTRKMLHTNTHHKSLNPCVNTIIGESHHGRMTTIQTSTQLRRMMIETHLAENGCYQHTINL